MPGYPSHNTILNIRSTNPQKRLWWNWEHDRHIYPNWETFAKTLDREYNVKIMAYINPFLSDVKSGMKPKGSWSRNYFQEASNQGYLVKRWKTVANGRRELVDYLVTSGPGLNAGMIDLSNPEACKWYKSLIKENMLANGVNGWMADFGEYLPYDGSIYLERIENKTLSAPYHNWYPREWARLNDEAIQEYFSKDPKKGDEIVFFSRSASRDSARFSRSYWNGDQMHIWNHLDGLESTVRYSLTKNLNERLGLWSLITGTFRHGIDPLRYWWLYHHQRGPRSSINPWRSHGWSADTNYR
jgi:alpha-glucosidase